jgi:hypothetical protein
MGKSRRKGASNWPELNISLNCFCSGAVYDEIEGVDSMVRAGWLCVPLAELVVVLCGVCDGKFKGILLALGCSVERAVWITKSEAWLDNAEGLDEGIRRVVLCTSVEGVGDGPIDVGACGTGVLLVDGEA